MRIENAVMGVMKESAFPDKIRHRCKRGIGIHEVIYVRFQGEIRHSTGVLI
jgi:hypothetical protein